MCVLQMFCPVRKGCHGTQSLLKVFCRKETEMLGKLMRHQQVWYCLTELFSYESLFLAKLSTAYMSNSLLRVPKMQVHGWMAKLVHQYMPKHSNISGSFSFPFLTDVHVCQKENTMHCTQHNTVWYSANVKQMFNFNT